MATVADDGRRPDLQRSAVEDGDVGGTCQEASLSIGPHASAEDMQIAGQAHLSHH